VAVDDLEGHLPPEPPVLGQKDRRHPPVADLLAKLVFGEVGLALGGRDQEDPSPFRQGSCSTRTAFVAPRTPTRAPYTIT
jgi:hypothetical protein